MEFYLNETRKNIEIQFPATEFFIMDILSYGIICANVYKLSSGVQIWYHMWGPNILGPNSYSLYITNKKGRVPEKNG